MVKGKSTNGLMKHIRDNHNVRIVGSKAKKELLQMGYYHGYKAYRYYKRSSNTFQINDFNEIKAIYDFDMNVKSLLYPYIMNIETAIKNYSIDTLVVLGDCSFDKVYENHLLYYRTKRVGSDEYQVEIKRRLNLRKKIQSTIYYEYGNDNPVIKHFSHSGEPIPLWAIFEAISFGTLGYFIQCLSVDERRKISENIGVHHNQDRQAVTLYKHIYILKGLRNAIAHNNIVFDCRFSNNRISNNILRNLSSELHYVDFTCETITDYVVIVLFYLKKIGFSKTELKSLVRKYKLYIEKFKSEVPQSVSDRVLGTNINLKISSLETYI